MIRNAATFALLSTLAACVGAPLEGGEEEYDENGEIVGAEAQALTATVYDFPNASLGSIDSCTGVASFSATPFSVRANMVGTTWQRNFNYSAGNYNPGALGIGSSYYPVVAPSVSTLATPAAGNDFIFEFKPTVSGMYSVRISTNNNVSLNTTLAVGRGTAGAANDGCGTSATEWIMNDRFYGKDVDGEAGASHGQSIAAVNQSSRKIQFYAEAGSRMFIYAAAYFDTASEADKLIIDVTQADTYYFPTTYWSWGGTSPVLDNCAMEKQMTRIMNVPAVATVALTASHADDFANTCEKTISGSTVTAVPSNVTRDFLLTFYAPQTGTYQVKLGNITSPAGSGLSTSAISQRIHVSRGTPLASPFMGCGAAGATPLTCTDRTGYTSSPAPVRFDAQRGMAYQIRVDISEAGVSTFQTVNVPVEVTMVGAFAESAINAATSGTIAAGSSGVTRSVGNVTLTPIAPSTTTSPSATTTCMTAMPSGVAGMDRALLVRVDVPATPSGYVSTNKVVATPSGTWPSYIPAGVTTATLPAAQFAVRRVDASGAPLSSCVYATTSGSPSISLDTLLGGTELGGVPAGSPGGTFYFRVETTAAAGRMSLDLDRMLGILTPGGGTPGGGSSKAN